MEKFCEIYDIFKVNSDSAEIFTTKLLLVGGTGELIFQVKIVWVGIRLRDFLVLMKLYFLHDRALIKFN